MNLAPMVLSLVFAVAPAPRDPKDAVATHTLKTHSSNVRCVCFSPDGQYMASACDGGVLSVHNVETGKTLFTHNHGGGFGSVDYSRDGKYLLTAGTNSIVRLFDAKTGKELKSFQGHTGNLYVARFTSDGKYIVSAGSDQNSRVWDVATGKTLRTLSTNSTYGMAVSPDGKYAVTAGERRELTLWDIGTGTKVREMSGHTAIVVWLDFSPDGRMVASAGYDGTVRIWETATGKERLRITAITNSPRVLMFSSCGRYLTVAAYDYSVRIFDTRSGKELFADRSLATSLYAAGFSPNRRYLAAGGGSGKLQLWDVSAITRKREVVSKEAMEQATFDDHWKNLGSEDGTESYKALVALSASGAMKYFAPRFAPPKPLTEEAKKKIPQLLKDMQDEDDDDKRKKAMDQLAGYGPAVLPILKAAIAKETDADVKLRLIVVHRRADITGAEEIRMARAIEVLERVGNDQAIKLLTSLAKGERGDGAAREAKLALLRLR